MTIKKIAIRGGHNFQAKGASALIDETIEDRKVYKATMNYLRECGYSVLDVTPGDCDVNTDLRYGVNKAEEWGADLFVSIHFDKCYDNYEGALGTATWICGTGGQAEIIARRIVNQVANGTGLKNRGVRTNPRLYELRKTSMPSIIIETCFCEATEDVRIYKNKGADLIGKLIAEGISCSNIQQNKSDNEETATNINYSGFYESDITKTNATIVGEGNIQVLDDKCNPIEGRYISSLDKIFVLGIYPSGKFIEVIYPGGSKRYHAYISIDNYDRISFDYHCQYQNDDGDTYVWWSSENVNKTEHDEVLAPNKKASPMYRENGWLRITFYREDGTPTDGYIRYEGEQPQKFYEEAKIKQGVVKVNSYLNVRDNVNGNIIGKVFNNEKVTIVWTETGWYYIEYNTSHGKKRGYVDAKYIEVE
ncbi:SH3 domain-containing protein [Clostridium perfringens]|uniref:SH3 domain-containing protein n=1 Tax=Clostridium perfringens TaxID=1502 RepID=A0AAP6WNB2_CLOPF|nr:N-acetylmuramoyl-L-alanine amidase [Clostridium perfringens]NGU31008.1 SH3 domain-containing protein [Clostridium perfringens]